MKRILLFIAMCYYVLAEMAVANTTSDSLFHQFRTLPRDTVRLGILNKIIRIEQNNYKCIQYSDILMKEALTLNSDKYASLASYYHSIYYYNRNEPDSVSKWITIMEPYVQKSGLWDLFFEVKRFQIDLYTYKEQYELAICEANKMKERAVSMNNNRGLVAAYQCLSNAYIGSQRWDEGAKASEKAHQLLKKNEDPVIRISVLTQLIYINNETKNYAKQLKYLKEQENTLNHHIARNPSLKKGFADAFIYNEIFFANYYLNTNQLQKAYNHLNKSRKYMSENTYLMYKVLFFDTHASYYQKMKDYQQASNYIDTTLHILPKDYSSNYAEQLLRKARIWVEAYHGEKALPLYQQALSIKDSASTALSNTQMEQIKNNYKIDKIKLEQEKKNNEIQLISLIIILFILLALFVIMYRASQVRKALKQSEVEIRKATEAVQNANETKNRFLSTMSYNIRTPLNNVVGFSQLIACEPEMSESTRQEYSDIIHKSSEYLMKLVNDVLDLSRLEAGMMKFQLQDYDIVELCNEACYMARMRNEKTGIQVEFQTDIESQIIHTDTARLTQALISMLTYPSDCQEARIVRFTVSIEQAMLRFRVTNSPLADSAFTSQETYIRSDINQLLLEHFGGSYLISPHTPEGPEIVFTYPLAAKSE